jgi:hypothetical protein
MGCGGRGVLLLADIFKNMKTSHEKIPKGFQINDTGVVSCSKPNNRPTISQAETSLAERWLQQFTKPSNTINTELNSYDLKHIIEKWANEYVSNGACIQAALNRNYKIEVIEESPNVFFGAQFFLPEDDWKRVKPSKFSKWLFGKIGEDTIIGDLARVAIFDRKWPRQSNDFLVFWEYLDSDIGADGNVLHALILSWEEYAGEKAPAPTNEIYEKCNAFYDGECVVVYDEESFELAPEGQTYIYVLYEEGKFGYPKVRYVGQSIDPSNRLKQHVLYPGSIDKVTWIGGLLNINETPKMAIIDSVDISSSFIAEKAYIYAFSELEGWQDNDLKRILLNKSMVKRR